MPDHLNGRQTDPIPASHGERSRLPADTARFLESLLRNWRFRPCAGHPLALAGIQRGMENESLEFRKIEDRCRELKQWILTHAPQCVTEEKYLLEDSQERGYWAHGYLSALLDVLRLFSRDISKSGYDEGAGSRYAA